MQKIKGDYIKHWAYSKIDPAKKISYYKASNANFIYNDLRYFDSVTVTILLCRLKKYLLING